MAATTRERIVHTSAELFRRQGYAATGVKQVVGAAKAPFGSLYHHFPGGKEELGAEVIRVSGGFYGRLIDLVYGPEPDPAAATEAFFAGAAETLAATDYADACPIATLALEVASTNEPLRRATATVFADWERRTAAYIERGGATPEAAAEAATAVLAQLEGAFMLSRAARSTEPMAVCGRAAAATVRGVLP